VSTIPADGSYAVTAPRADFGVEPPEARPEPSLPVIGAVTGASTSLAVMFVYQLLRISWQLVHEVTRSGAGAASGLESPDRIFGVQVVGGLLSLAPAILAGGVLGAVTGGLLVWSRRHQGLIRSWLTGSMVAYVAAFILNVTVLARHRTAALEYLEWRRLVGLPSLLFVLIFGGVGVYLHLRQTRGTTS
jgi:ribose/xylose/arabinose/galactoside ABC-type transport system permease subunit